MLIPPHLFLSGFHAIYPELGQKDSHIKTELLEQYQERLTLLGDVFWLHSYQLLFTGEALLYKQNVYI